MMINRLTVLLTIMIMALAINSCSESEPELYSLEGVWYYGENTSHDNYDITQIVLARDGSFTSSQSVMTPGATETTYNYLGQWWLDDKTLNIYYTGLGTDVYTVNLIDSSSRKLYLSIRGKQVVWCRSASDL